MMEDLSKDSSLEIVESKHQIEFSQEMSGHCEADSDLDLDYSRDEPSLSFAIEEEKGIVEARHSKEMPLNNQPPKKKRREIFERFKQPIMRGQADPTNSLTNSEFIKTIDQIFQVDSRPVISDPPSKFTKKNIAVEIQAVLPLQKEIDAGDGNVLPLQSKQPVKDVWSSEQFFNVQSEGRVSAENDILNLSDIENCCSFIDPRNSRDSASFLGEAQDLAEILKVGIFSPEGTPHQQQNSPPINACELTVNKTSEVGYDKIQISSLAASNFMMKESMVTVRELGDSRNVHSCNALINGRQIGNYGLSNDFSLSQLKEERIPVFLRKLRLLNSVYPNLNHLQIRSDPEFEKANVKQISNCLADILDFLAEILELVNQKRSLCDQLIMLVSQDIRVEEFLDFPWDQITTFPELQDLRPRQNFHNRKWNQQKALKALQNYSQIAAHYSKVRINLSDERGRKKYRDIRQKFIDIESNLRMISEDLYTSILAHSLPSHYFECRQILIENKVMFSNSEIGTKKKQMQKLRSLQYQGEELSCSEVGPAAILKLHHIIKMSSCF